MSLDNFLSLHITKRCNLRCSHCYQKEYPSVDIILEYANKAIELFRPQWIVFYGGEPMVLSGILKEIMDTYPNKKFLIYTNGTIWDETVFNRIDKIVVTLESFFYEEAVKYRPLTKKQHEINLRILSTYRDKSEILHNIYPCRHDEMFYRMARLYEIPVQSYPIILESEKFHFQFDILESGLCKEREPLVKPKLRILENGMVTRDMRGIYNLSHINDWRDELKTVSLPVHEKCKECRYYKRCPACNVFPYFCYDILNKIKTPHFCGYTEALWKSLSSLR